MIRRPATMPLLLLLLLTGCSSIDGRLYAEGDPPRLRDGTVTLRTRWFVGAEQAEEIRRVRARDGKVSCELSSPERGHFVGEVPLREWEKLWNVLFESDPFGAARYDVQTDDPKGGPYHLVRLELGSRGAEFSAQMRKNLLVFSSRDTNERLRHSGAIADLVAAHATTKLDASSPAVTPGQD